MNHVLLWLGLASVQSSRLEPIQLKHCTSGVIYRLQDEKEGTEEVGTVENATGVCKPQQTNLIPEKHQEPGGWKKLS